MKDNNCIFCKLASGEIPSATIYAVSYTHLDVYKRQIIALLLIFKSQLISLINTIFDKVTSESAGI